MQDQAEKPHEAIEGAPQTFDQALLALQAEAISISKDAEADTGKYKYKYLTLDKLLEEVLPKLSELKLLWLSLPAFLDGTGPALKYTLKHIPTGEKLEGVMSLGLKAGYTPQDLGGALSYMRRYALVTVLNIGQPDEDGAISTPQGRGNAGQQGVRRVTEARVKKIIEGAEAAGCLDKLQLAATHARGGVDVGDCSTKAKTITALKKLNAAEAEQVESWIARKTAEALGESGDA